ncbi:conserved hypothetical protein [Ahrensia sp. R2A130]|nr:conserved hypothetical protein [Ahrensia sp. R2A130]
MTTQPILVHSIAVAVLIAGCTTTNVPSNWLEPSLAHVSNVFVDT